MTELAQHDAEEFEKKIAELKENRDMSDEDAIKLSALKWDLIAVDLVTPKGPRNCALCITHLNCKGCPVAADTGFGGCSNTPHDKWIRYQTPENARAEADYLRGLLTKAENNGT